MIYALEIDVTNLLQALGLIGGIAVLLGIAIGIASKYFEVREHPLVEMVYDMLPHFNCGACGTPGCMANANEIVFNNQKLESCKPGTAVMRKNIQKALDDYASGKLVFDNDPNKKEESLD
jgi:electron transport complex protein RnfB